ncbi:MAG: hypothetical protein KDA61_11210, partial [Planctomycetales bacterium]|nr:hypothetical protein [Planctomycetales bacterium]
MSFRHPFLLIAFLVASPSARADLVVESVDGDGVNLTVYQMTVNAAPEPVPALRYHLTVRESEMKHGNAAVYYLRGIPEGNDPERVFERLQKDFPEDDVHGRQGPGWYSVERPLASLDRKKLAEASRGFDRLYDSFVLPGSMRRDCDWGHGQIFEMSGPDIYAFLLPDVQTMRNFSRALMLRARAAIARGDYDAAVETLRVNYQLGRHVGESPFLVSSLVGIAITSMSNAIMVDLISAKDSPNLYWALSELPDPLVNVRKATQIEMDLGARVVPVLQKAETAEHAPEEWSRLLAEDFKQLTKLLDSQQMWEELIPYTTAGAALVMYPPAKQRLLESGMDAARVEAMPVGQVLAIDAAREYRKRADGMEKWYYVPWREARVRQRAQFESDLAESRLSGGFGVLLADLLLPAVESARTAEIRVAWQIGGLRTVEALRMHAAATGQFPERLQDVKIVPLPV